MTNKETTITITKKREIELKVFIWREKDMYVAWEPRTGVASQGKSLDEAIENIKEAIELYLEDPDAEIPKPINKITIATIKIKTP